MPRPAAVVRVVTGVVFVVFGLPKFTDHPRWIADFGTYGLPESSRLVYATGSLEILGGLALAIGAGARVAAVTLALVMAGAVIGGGSIGDNPTSLTLAPVLLVSTLFVAWTMTGASPRARASGWTRRRPLVWDLPRPRRPRTG